MINFLTETHAQVCILISSVNTWPEWWFQYFAICNNEHFLIAKEYNKFQFFSKTKQTIKKFVKFYWSGNPFPNTAHLQGQDFSDLTLYLSLLSFVHFVYEG